MLLFFIVERGWGGGGQHAPGGLPYQYDRGCSSYVFEFEKAVFVPLRVMSLTAGALRVPCRVLSREKYGC